MSRVIQGVIAGVGFLCAGTIIQVTGEDHIRGLTTAAGIWLTAAIGIAVGLGRETTAVLSTFLALGILALEGPIRRLLGKRRPSDEQPTRASASIPAFFCINRRAARR